MWLTRSYSNLRITCSQSLHFQLTRRRTPQKHRVLQHIEQITTKKMHYETVPKTYHTAFFYVKDSPYEKWQLQLIKECLCEGSLAAKPSLRIADIGGGTGRFAHLLAKDLELTSPVLCVDPFPAMLAEAEELEGVQTECLDAISFVDQSATHSFDVCLMKEMVHHIPNEQVAEFYAGVHKVLDVGGVCLTVTRPKHAVEYPFFEAAKQVWVENQPDVAEWESAMKIAGFTDIQVKVHDFPVSISMQQWTDMIRDRYWSTFSEEHFTEEQLEQGIEEIKRVWEGKEVLNFNERMVFLSGVRGAVDSQ